MAGKNKNKNLGLMLVLAAIAVMFLLSNGGTFLGASVAQGGTSEIERELSATSAFTGDEITVKYQITIGSSSECGEGQESLCNDFYVIDDQLPPEVDVININSQLCEFIEGTPNRVVCIKLQGAESTTLEYTVRMPSSQQEVVFSGTYMIQGDETLNSLYGDSFITVQETGSCIPDWECTSYGDWTFPSNQCGTRTRTCTDLNDCGTNTGKPIEIDNVACPDAECGNNQAETGEVCDGNDLNGLNCAALGDFSGGTLGCLPNCGGYDTASCIPNEGTGGNDKGSCISDWECEAWTACIDGQQTRTCRDKNYCYNPTNVPDQEIPCESGGTTFDPTWLYVIIGGVVIYLMAQSSSNKKSSKKKRGRK